MCPAKLLQKTFHEFIEFKVEESATAAMQIISSKGFQESFWLLYSDSHKCIAAAGVYFEGVVVYKTCYQ